jgi:hypothetical protein
MHRAKFAELYENGPKCEVTPEQMMSDPWLSCTKNFMKRPEVIVEMEAIERLARILPDDHRVVTNGVDNRCTFVNTNLDPMLKEKYSGVKRVKMPDGEGKHVGYIYHFRNSDMFYNSGEWIQEDWVEVKEVEEKNVRPSMFV